MFKSKFSLQETAYVMDRKFYIFYDFTAAYEIIYIEFLFSSIRNRLSNSDFPECLKTNVERLWQGPHYRNISGNARRKRGPRYISWWPSLFKHCGLALHELHQMKGTTYIGYFQQHQQLKWISSVTLRENIHTRLTFHTNSKQVLWKKTPSILE